MIQRIVDWFRTRRELRAVMNSRVQKWRRAYELVRQENSLLYEQLSVALDCLDRVRCENNAAAAAALIRTKTLGRARDRLERNAKRTRSL